MSIVVILVSTVLVSNYVDVVSGSLLVRTQLMLSAVRNSLFGAEVIYEGPKVEAIYVIERSDQTKRVENTRKKIENQKPKKGSNQSANSDSADKLNKLDREAKEIKFCSPSVLGNICQRTFTNSYFSKHKWSLQTTSKPECLQKQISAEKDKKSFEYSGQLVKCMIKSEKGDSNIFLEASASYESRNLRYFVMTEENGKLKPKAFLINKPEPKVPKDTKQPKVPKETKEPKVQMETKEPKVQMETKEPKVQMETKEPKVQMETKEPKGPMKPTSNDETIMREIPIEDGSISTTTIPTTFVGMGNRTPPLTFK